MDTYLSSPETRQIDSALGANAVGEDRMSTGVTAAWSGLAPTDSRSLNNLRRTAAYVLTYRFVRGALPENLQPTLGRLLLYPDNGKNDTDTQKATKALKALGDGNIADWPGYSANLSAGQYWALAQRMKALGRNVQVYSGDPNPGDPYTRLGNNVMPPADWQGYDTRYTLSLMSAGTKQVLGIDGNGNLLPVGTTPAQAQAAAQQAPTVQVSAAVAVPPPPTTGNPLTDSVNTLVHGAQTATFEATGKKFSPVQMGLILTAFGLLIGFGIYFVGVLLERKR
jgi:hypothetical protein